MRSFTIHILFILVSQLIFSQNTDVLNFSEYLGYVKKHHPIVKQANLLISEAEAKLLKARGSFDPKLEVDYDRKKFKDLEYFDKLNAAFKIPTWYGIELKGNFENNSGVFLNPEANLPEDGLYTMGVSFSLAKGLLINERMSTLKQAKLYQEQTAADNQLFVNEILYNSTITYFKWLKAYRKKEVYKAFLNNAKLRLQGVKRSYSLGESPAIDTIEARIILNNRNLNLEEANLDYIKSTLELSNYLWINDVPVELQDNILPDLEIKRQIDEALQLEVLQLESDLTNHPKLKSLDLKFRGLEVEKRLNRNNLLPQIDLQYNFLTENSEDFNSFNSNNYKAGVNVSFPLFLRKERADLRLTNYKLQAVNFEKQTVELTLKNKLNSVQEEIGSYENQIVIAEYIVTDYSILLKGEERKFALGESSLFLLKSRESNLIKNKLKAIELEYSFLKSKGKLFNVLGNN